MQKEAEQRVREMQSRTRLSGESNIPHPLPQKSSSFSQQNHSAENRDFLSSVISGTESDRLMILALLWILWNEHSDPKLLLALLYLLL